VWVDLLLAVLVVLPFMSLSRVGRKGSGIIPSGACETQSILSPVGPQTAPAVQPHRAPES